MQNEPKLPDVTVELVGHDGNAFSILGRVMNAMRAAGHADQVDAYHDEATAGDYNNLLAVTMRWVNVS